MSAWVELDMDGTDDGPLGGIIVDISEDTVLVDCNHPMAGKTAFFELTFHGFTAPKPPRKKK